MHISAANSSTVILPDVSFLSHPKICGLIHLVITSPPRFLGKIHHCCQTPHQYCWNLRVWAGGYRKGWKHTELKCYLFTESSCFWDQTSLFFFFLSRLLHIMNKQQITTREKNPTGNVLIFKFRIFWCEMFKEKWQWEWLLAVRVSFRWR